MQTTVPQYDCNRTYVNSDVTSGSKRRQDLHQLRGSGEGGEAWETKAGRFYGTRQPVARMLLPAFGAGWRCSVCGLNHLQILSILLAR